MIGNYNSWNLKAKDFEFYKKNKFKIISEITENDYQHKKFSNKFSTLVLLDIFLITPIKIS